MTAVQQRRYGTLNAHLVDAYVTAGPIDLVVVLFHGYGAPGTDLVGLGEEVASQLPAQRNVRYVFPEAPLSLDDIGLYQGRAWWHLSIQSLLQSFENQDFERIRSFSPEGVDQAREAADIAIAAALDEVGLDRSRLILGGFSQGAMLATELALHRGDAIRGLVLWSGTLIREGIWKKRAAESKPLQIVQSHGTRDPILPFVTATWLRDLLVEAGHHVNFLKFAGPHTIPMEALQAMVDLINQEPPANR